MRLINSLKTQFPFVKLSYEKILHTKVLADYYILEPKGEAGFIWFTSNHSVPIAYLVKINKYNNIENINPISVCFDRKLSLGTILYGIYFNIDDIKHFCCLDITFYKGEEVSNKLFSDKLILFHSLFKNYIGQYIYSTDYTLLSMPYLSTDIKKTFASIDYSFYTVNSVIFRRDLERTIYKLNIFNKSQIEKVFRIYADLMPDIYRLFCIGPKSSELFVGYAHIPDYKTSILMNSLFRNIPENYNLDLIEESEEEEEFQNIELDKYVNLNKGLPFLCYYNKRFGKWIPKKYVPGQSISNNYDLQKYK